MVAKEVLDSVWSTHVGAGGSRGGRATDTVLTRLSSRAHWPLLRHRDTAAKCVKSATTSGENCCGYSTAVATSSIDKRRQTQGGTAGMMATHGVDGDTIKAHPRRKLCSLSRICCLAYPSSGLRTPRASFGGPHHAQWCTNDGAQHAACAFERVGINATDNRCWQSGRLANGRGHRRGALGHRPAEATTNFEAVVEVAECTVGGLLYVTLVLTVVLVGLTLFPCVNCLGRFFYDLLCFSASAATRSGDAFADDPVARGEEIRVVDPGRPEVPLAGRTTAAQAPSPAAIDRFYLKKDSSSDEEKEGL